MIHKPLAEIGKEDIEALVENEISEGRTIEYKLLLPGNTDSDKKEFLADVSSFANASGGDLLFGIAEKEGAPVDVPGLPHINLDAEILRLDNIIRDGVEPRIQGVGTHSIGGFTKGPVLLIRIPKSSAPPHMVSFKNTSRFYTRNNAGKYLMDVTDIGASFALSKALPERIKRFRDDRLAKIVAGGTPVPLKRGPKAVLHIIPLVAFSGSFQVSVSDMMDQRSKLHPMRGLGASTRPNLDGFVSYHFFEAADGAPGYCQVFRSGIIESVSGRNVGELHGTSGIRSILYEQDLVEAVRNNLDGLRAMGVPLPVQIMHSMTGVKGATLVVAPRYGDPKPIDRDMLILPEVLVENYDCDVPQTLRPIFDAVWNACGYERSFHYDDTGNWNPRT